MMQVMEVLSPLVGSTFTSSRVIESDWTSASGLSLASKPNSPTVCKLDISKSSASSSESSRRSLMLATMASLTGATGAGFITQPGSAQAAKRKPPPPAEEKEDDKYLSAYDAKVLANIRRKEALKAQLETQKAKAKIVREPVQPPLDIFGQVLESQAPESQVLEGQVSK